MAAGRDIPGDGALSILLLCPFHLEFEGLRLALEQDDDLRVVGVGSGDIDVPLLAKRPGVGAVVLGWGWAEGRCIELLDQLRGGAPNLPVLVVSADPRPAHVQLILSAGARGVLPADVDVDELIHAVHSAVGGDQLVLHRTLASSFFSHAATAGDRSARGARFDSLTPREREVVGLLARGLNDKDLAQSLFISVRTVQTHLAHIYGKLGVHTRTEVALMAVREGWASQPDTDTSPESR